jgi:hypothetical protein
VLEADRESRRRPDEATGEVETWDDKKLAKLKMGERVMRGGTRAPEVEEKLKKSREK